MMTNLEKILAAQQTSFHRVVDFSGNDILQRLDLSKNNTELTEFIYSDTDSFTAYISKFREQGKAKYMFVV